MKGEDKYIGKKFGMLLVISLYESINYVKKYNCICDCGNKNIVRETNLCSGGSRSCGCVRNQNTSKRCKIEGLDVHTVEYRTWSSIKSRCYGKSDFCNKYYKDRGIIVSDEWRYNYNQFVKDMGLRPSPKHSIERKDTNGNYEKSNCIWATMEIQSRNKRNNRWIEFNGIKMILSDWAKYLGIQKDILSGALKRKTFQQACEYYLKKYGSLPVKK